MLKYFKFILLFIAYFHSVSISAQESNDRFYINFFNNIFDIEINELPDKEYLKAIYEINYNFYNINKFMKSYNFYPLYIEHISRNKVGELVEYDAVFEKK